MKKYITKILLIICLLIFTEHINSQTSLLIEGQTYTNSSESWPGVVIDHYMTSILLTFRNNSITSVNTDGYMLNCGDDDYYSLMAHNLDNSVISGNKFDWNGTPGATLCHGIIAGYSINYNIKYNYIDGPFYPIVHEGGYDDGTPMENTDGGIHYNIIKNGSTLVVDGFKNVNVYNNTFYYDITTSYESGMIRVGSSNGTTIPAPSENVKIKNNIFYTTTDRYAIVIDDVAAVLGFECDYNIYYWANAEDNEPFFAIGENEYTWDQWRALGYDTHSVIINPDFISTTTLVPSSPLFYGIDLGNDFEYGLSTSAIWTVDEYPDTLTQGIYWQCGARLYDNELIGHIDSTYYVSTSGNDSWNGKYPSYISGNDGPWATWEEAFTNTSVKPGNKVFIKGGVYNITITNGDGYNVTRAGTSDKWIIYSNYPGETPILECSGATASGGSNIGIGLWPGGGANYIKLKGLTVRNVLQKTGSREIWCEGFVSYNGFFELENCVAYNIDGIGFLSEFYNGESYANGEHTFINCDAYNCSNTYAIAPAMPGNRGAGFQAKNFFGVEGRSIAYGCRAWECGDQGFSWNSEHYCEANECWSFNNGKLQGDGHGFKLGWHDREYNGTDRLNVIIQNCIAAYNRASGITTNDAGEGIATGMNIFNNTVYHNGYHGGGYSSTYGFYIYNTPDDNTDELLRVFRNNISYDNEGGAVYLGSGAYYTHSNNSWDGGATITSADFVALPSNMANGITLLSSARQADGSLPDLGNYFKLTEGSDAVDAGIDVGLPYGGSAPDIGAFEYDGEAQSNATDILTFTLADQTGAATINTTNHTIAIEVAYTADVTALTPTITLSYGATVIPASGVSRDFTTPQTYTVTALDGTTTQEWVVTVTQEEEPVDPPSEGTQKMVKFGTAIIRL